MKKHLKNRGSLIEGIAEATSNDILMVPAPRSLVRQCTCTYVSNGWEREDVKGNNEVFSTATSQRKYCRS